MTMRPCRAIRRLPLLAAAVAFAAVAHTAFAAGPGGPDASQRERVSAVEIGVDGKGGVLVTEAEYLGGTDARYRFGTACGTPIAESVLLRLFGSLSDQRPITIAAEDKAGGPPCITRLTFHSQ